MDKNLLIEVGDYSTNLIIPDNNNKIDFDYYSEELCCIDSTIYLYYVSDNYYESDNLEEDNQKELIATIEGKFFDIDYAVVNGISLFSVFDQEDGDTASLIQYLLDSNGDIKDEYFSIYNNIYYLDRIEVQEKYRGKGYAKFLLNNLKEILMYCAKLRFGIIMIQAQPFDRVNGECVMDYENKERIERLIKLYENTGFERIENSNYLISINE